MTSSTGFPETTRARRPNWSGAFWPASTGWQFPVSLTSVGRVWSKERANSWKRRTSLSTWWTSQRTRLRYSPSFMVRGIATGDTTLPCIQNLPFIPKVLRTVQSPVRLLEIDARLLTLRVAHERPHRLSRSQTRSALQAHAAVSAWAGHCALQEDHDRGRAGRAGAGQGHAGGVARGAAGAVRGRVRRHQSLFAARASAAVAQYPGRQGGQRQRQVRRVRCPQER